MTAILRLVEGRWIEFEGVRIARLEPKLSPSLIGRLEEMFEAFGEDAEYIVELEWRIKVLEEELSWWRRSDPRGPGRDDQNERVGPRNGRRGSRPWGVAPAPETAVLRVSVTGLRPS